MLVLPAEAPDVQEIFTLDRRGFAAHETRFRDLLVHGYADVNDERVLAILRTRPSDLRAFREAMASLAAPTARRPGEGDVS